MDGLKLESVRIALRDTVLLQIDAWVKPGEVLAVMGPSGSGKSTLLSYIAGTLDPVFRAGGSIRLNGVDLGGLPPERRHVGLLFQDALLFPHLSVAGNILFGMPRHHPDRRERAEQLLAGAGLGGFGPRDPATLSGGQKARVALLRTLAAEPRAILLDEPFSSLDAALRAEMRAYVFERIRQVGVPAVLVTHDSDDAVASGGRIIELS